MLKNLHRIKSAVAISFLICFSLSFVPGISNVMHHAHHDHEHQAHHDEENCKVLDSCHLSIFHHSSEVDCNHSEHLLETEELCQECTKITSDREQFSKEVSGEFASSSSFESPESNYVSDFILSPDNTRFLRGPPLG